MTMPTDTSMKVGQPQDDLTRILHEEAGNRILEVERALASVEVEMLPRLPERLFAQVFVPLFAGEVQDQLQQQELHKQWLMVCGNPFHEVAIIETDNRDSAVLFRVPPLFDRTTVRSIVESRTTLGHIMRSADQYSRISPQSGRSYMVEQLKRFEIFKDIEEHRMAFAERWNVILTRYGKPPLTKAKAVSAEGVDFPGAVADDPLMF